MTNGQRELTCDTPDGIRLAGTLSTPGPGVWPAALILNGSGPLDRDSAMRGQALGFACALADALAGVGVASLRFDKRGVGASSGEYLSTGFHAEAEDASAILAALAAAPEVDSQRIVVVGHSIGAVIAMRLVAADPGITAVVMLAGPARNGRDVLAWQTERIAATLPGPGWLLPNAFVALQRHNLDRVMRSTRDTVLVLFRRHPAKWMREFIRFDPESEFRQVHCPVLAITGGKDLQVNPDDVNRIGSLVAGSFVGETPANLTHVLRQQDGPAGILTYASQLKRPVDPALVRRICRWIADRSGAPRPGETGSAA